MKGLTRQILVGISCVIMLVANFGFGDNDFSDTTVEDTIYNNFDTAFTPTSLTFLIWFPIFLGCIAFTVYQFLPKNRDDAGLDAIAVPIVAAFVFNALTPFFELGFSNIQVTLLLISLVFAYLTVNRHRKHERSFYWFTQLPVSIFFAWITVATILNMAQFLKSTGWDGFGIPPAIWSVILISIATVIGIFILNQFKETAFAVVLIWAFGGIALGQLEIIPIVITVFIATLVLAGLVVQQTVMVPQQPLRH
ncbi:MAG: tryptophan-rich sensory protein [Chloroflexota bacterium]